MCGHGELCGHHGHGGCCGPPGGLQGRYFHRYFPSREERIVRMEEYLKDLQAEAKAVKEHIAEMKAAK